MANFLQSIKQKQIAEDLAGLIMQQLAAGNVTETDVQKFIELVKNTPKLKMALTLL